MARPGVVVKVESNARQVRRQFSQALLRELPFATAKSLTQVAQLARDHVRQNLRSSFTVRSKRVPRGITIRPARKQDWPRPTALVGTRDQFMADHALGVVRRAKRKRYLAIPTKLVKRTATGKVRKRDKPSEIIRRGGHIRNDTIRERLRTTGSKQRRRVRSFFFLRRRVRIKKRWPFRLQVLEKAQREYGSIFTRNLRLAFLDAKRRGKA